MNNGIIYQYAGDEIIGLFGTSGGDPEKISFDTIRAAFLDPTDREDVDTQVPPNLPGPVGLPAPPPPAIRGDAPSPCGSVAGSWEIP